MSEAEEKLPRRVPSAGLTPAQCTLRDALADWVNRNIGKFSFNHRSLLELEEIIKDAVK